MAQLELIQIEGYPKELLDINSEQLYTIFPQPTLLHLSGLKKQPIFISILLHGNERTGLDAIQQLLKKYHKQKLPRSLSIFFGNAQAARYGQRALEGQPDFNRTWPSTTESITPEVGIMQEIVDEMHKRQVQVSIDVHNNTGLNPHYACVNKLTKPFLKLASLFSETVVYFLSPRGVQSMAFSEICPAITLECGKPDTDAGAIHAFEYIDTILNMNDTLLNDASEINSIKLFHTLARVKVPLDVSFSFTDQSADILFANDLETMNFSEVPAGTYLGSIHSDSNVRLSAFNDDDKEIGKDLFYIEGQQIKLKKAMMPAMLTLDEMVIRQDCLCYLMERLPQSEYDKSM